MNPKPTLALKAICILAIFLGLSTSCISLPFLPGDTGASSANSSKDIAGTKPETGKKDLPLPSKAPASADEEAKELLASALEALDNNHLTEAIRAYISVMAVADASPSAATKSASEKALAELTKIGTRLSLEAGDAWMAADGKQLSESTRGIGREGVKQPSVALYENYGTGKAPIADAPIAFEFVKNSGTMNAFGTTDGFGRASTAILKLDSTGEAAIVRAIPVFKSRGFSFAFKSLAREFNYLPPSTLTLAVSLAKSELGVEHNSLAADIMAGSLKAAGLSVAPAIASLQQELFLSAYQGEQRAVRELLAQAQASYLLLVYIDLDSIRQVEYNGKLYNLYSALGKATLRLIRSDGSIVHTLVLENLKGDGGSRTDAVRRAYITAHEELSTRLKADIPKLRQALQKE